MWIDNSFFALIFHPETKNTMDSFSVVDYNKCNVLKRRRGF